MQNPDDDTVPPLAVQIMPTGSGVADLEIAREQAALADDGELTGSVEGPDTLAIQDSVGTGSAAPNSGRAVDESEAHPS